MTNFPERITVINEVIEGLAPRLEDAVRIYQTSDFLSAPVNLKYLQNMVKRFPEFKIELEKGPSPLQNNAGALLDEFEPVYRTFLDLIELKRVIAEIIREIGSSVTSLKFGSNHAFLDGLLAMVSGFIRIFLAVGGFEQKKAAVSVYALAYRFSRNVTEPSLMKLSTFLNEVENERKLLTEIMEPLNSRLVEASLSYSSELVHSTDIALMRKDGVLSMIQSPEKLLYPECDPFLLFLLRSGDYINWLLLVFLLNPSEMGLTGAFDVLKTALQETFVVPIYSSTCLEIFPEFEKAFSSYKSASLKLAKHKGVITDAANHFLTEGIARRKSMRIYLRQELGKMLSVITERPGIMGPKITVILAALGMAKKEIEFYFYCNNAQLPKGKSKVSPDALKDKQAIQLIQLTKKTKDFVLLHKDTIQEYTMELLSERDYTKLYTLFENAKSENIPFSEKISSLFEAIINRLAGLKMEDPDSIDLRDVRMNWYRIQCALSLAQAPVRLNTIKELATNLNIVCHRTRYIDDLEKLLEETCSLDFLSHFGDEMLGMWKEALTFSQGQAFYVDTFFDIMAEIGNKKTEGMAARGQKAVKLAKSYIASISSNVLGLLDYLMSDQGLKWIFSQTNPLQALTIQDVKGKKAAQAPDIPKPGTESYFHEKQMLAPLENWTSQLSLILNSLDILGEVQIYNVKFLPLRYIYNGISDFFSTKLREMMKLDTENREKFVYVVNEVSGLIHILKVCDHSANIGVGEACRRTLLSHFYDRSGCTDEERAALADINGAPLIDEIRDWFENFITKRLIPPGIIYSPLRKQFISRATLPFKAEEYFDLVELKALALLVGPSGMRVIDTMMLKLLKKFLVRIKDHLTDNKANLLEMMKVFPQRSKYEECVRKMRGIDALYSNATSFGLVLELRSLLMEAQHEVLQERLPLAVECVQNVQGQYNGSVFQVTEYADCDKLAFEMGIKAEATDPYLHNLFREMNEAPEDADVWKLMPIAFSTTFYSPLWKDAGYRPNLDANLNNVHCMMTAINTLIVDMEAIIIQFQQTQGTPDERYVVEQLRKFIEFSSIILLNLNTDATPQKELPLMFLFLGKFVTQSRHLTVNMLEECIPYALLRSIYLQVIEKRFAEDSGDVDAF